MIANIRISISVKDDLITMNDIHEMLFGAVSEALEPLDEFEADIETEEIFNDNYEEA